MEANSVGESLFVTESSTADFDYLYAAVEPFCRPVADLKNNRVIRSRLRSSDEALSPERALEQLTRIHHHCIRIAQRDLVIGVSAIGTEQAQVFSALGVKKPAASHQLSLL